MKRLQEVQGGQIQAALVLDMRNNPGGLLDQAVSVADTFLSKGNIVYIQGQGQKEQKGFQREDLVRWRRQRSPWWS